MSSSSSSLAGARRRRVGGGSGPTSTGGPTNQRQQQQQQYQQHLQQQQQQQQQQSRGNPPTQESTPFNPLSILKEHHMKLNIIEETIREITMAREQTNDNQTNDNQIINNQTNNQIDIEKITQIVITNIEKQLDFKVFYENDANLMNEIESLKKTLKSQQMVINGLNMALFNLVSKLNVNLPNTHVNNDVTNDVNNDVTNDVM